MNKSNPLKILIKFALLAAIMGGWCRPLLADETAAIKPQLTGAELYSMHCNRCHPERYPTERTAAQWKTITLHMQIRANIPGNQARLILKYLQENSGR